MTVPPKMKTAALTILLLSAAALPLIADTLAISIVEESSAGESKNIASVRADDEATRSEILKLWEKAKKAFPQDRRNLFGPDSGYVAVTLKNGREEILVRSWHPLFERNPKLVVTSNGVETLNGRTHNDVLKSDKTWYLQARRTFDEIVSYAKTKAK